MALRTGHALAYEGAPHDEQGQRIVTYTRHPGVGGPGRAKCACGELSDVLVSAYQRKAWYREHKAEAQAQEVEALDG